MTSYISFWRIHKFSSVPVTHNQSSVIHGLLSIFGWLKSLATSHTVNKNLWYTLVLNMKTTTNVDWRCFYYSSRNSLVALLEALCAQMYIWVLDFWSFCRNRCQLNRWMSVTTPRSLQSVRSHIMTPGPFKDYYSLYVLKFHCICSGPLSAGRGSTMLTNATGARCVSPSRDNASKTRDSLPHVTVEQNRQSQSRSPSVNNAGNLQTSGVIRVR